MAKKVNPEIKDKVYINGQYINDHYLTDEKNKELKDVRADKIEKSVADSTDGKLVGDFSITPISTSSIEILKKALDVTKSDKDYNSDGSIKKNTEIRDDETTSTVITSTDKFLTIEGDSSNINISIPELPKKVDKVFAVDTNNYVIGTDSISLKDNKTLTKSKTEVSPKNEPSVIKSFDIHSDDLNITQEASDKNISISVEQLREVHAVVGAATNTSSLKASAIGHTFEANCEHTHNSFVIGTTIGQGNTIGVILTRDTVDRTKITAIKALRDADDQPILIIQRGKEDINKATQRTHGIARKGDISESIGWDREDVSITNPETRTVKDYINDNDQLGKEYAKDQIVAHIGWDKDGTTETRTVKKYVDDKDKADRDYSDAESIGRIGWDKKTDVTNTKTVKKYVDDEIAATVAASHYWMPSISSYTALPVITAEQSTKTWLIRTLDLNDVYQWISPLGSSAAGNINGWMLYANDTDYIDPIELGSAFSTHNADALAHSPLRARITTNETDIASLKLADTATGSRIGLVEDRVTATEGRLDAAEGRLDTAEADITSNKTLASSNEDRITGIEDTYVHKQLKTGSTTDYKELTDNNYTNQEKLKLSQVDDSLLNKTADDFGKVDDVRVNGTTIVVNKIADLLDATQSKTGLLSVADKTKLDGIESGAQVNIIESITVNGTAVAVTNKTVEIPVPEVSKIAETIEDKNNTEKPLSVWYGTKAEYDALVTADTIYPDYIYNISDDDDGYIVYIGEELVNSTNPDAVPSMSATYKAVENLKNNVIPAEIDKKITNKADIYKPTGSEAKNVVDLFENEPTTEYGGRILDCANTDLPATTNIEIVFENGNKIAHISNVLVYTYNPNRSITLYDYSTSTWSVDEVLLQPDAGKIISMGVVRNTTATNWGPDSLLLRSLIPSKVDPEYNYKKLVEMESKLDGIGGSQAIRIKSSDWVPFETPLSSYLLTIEAKDESLNQTGLTHILGKTSKIQVTTQATTSVVGEYNNTYEASRITDLGTIKIYSTNNYNGKVMLSGGSLRSVPEAVVVEKYCHYITLTCTTGPNEGTNISTMLLSTRSEPYASVLEVHKYITEVLNMALIDKEIPKYYLPVSGVLFTNRVMVGPVVMLLGGSFGESEEPVFYPMCVSSSDTGGSLYLAPVQMAVVDKVV